MRAAIYARYSSENQRPESITDQIYSCRKYATERSWAVDDTLIFSDEAVSGAREDRAGLHETMEAARNTRFDVLLVDDLSRLARNNLLMLTIIADLRFCGVRVVSVADGLDSDQEEANFSIQLRGIANELFLTDLRKKVLRGLIGQKNRGFFVGERAFGYRSVPFGTGRRDKRGQPRPDGFKMEIIPSEANVVIEIFTRFASGGSFFSIVNDLNRREVPGRFRKIKRWSAPTISRMLRNEKYIGRWIWNRTEHRKDPRTLKSRQFPKDPTKCCVIEDESLRIIPQELWQKVQERFKELESVWRRGGRKRGYESQRVSRVLVYLFPVSTSWTVRGD
jgi:site-specific DNA recombinase